MHYSLRLKKLFKGLDILEMITYEIFHHNQLPNPDLISDRQLHIYGNLNDRKHLIVIPEITHYIYDLKIVCKKFMDNTTMLDQLSTLSIYLDHTLLIRFDQPTHTYDQEYHKVYCFDMFFPILAVYGYKISLELEFKDRIEQKYSLTYKTANSNDWYPIYRIQNNQVKLVLDNSYFIYRPKHIL